MTSRLRTLSPKTLSIATLILCCAFAFSVRAQSPRGITPEDYFSLEFARDPNFSPDGKLVAYVVTKIDRAQNRRNSAIWMAATDGSRAPWQFTTSPQSSNSPRWSLDGKSIGFLSSRPDRKSTRLNSSHSQISYAVFCLKKKNEANVLGLFLFVIGFLTHFEGGYVQMAQALLLSLEVLLLLAGSSAALAEHRDVAFRLHV